MITQIRRGLKSRAFKTAIWIFLIALAGGGVLVQFVFDVFTGSQWAMKINGSKITPMQFKQKAMREEDFLKVLRKQLGSQADFYLQLYGIEDNPALLAKKQLAREVILDQQVKKIGFTVDADYIAEKIHDSSFVNTHMLDIVPWGVFVPGKGFDSTRLHAELKRLNLTESDFERELERAVARYILTSQLVSPAAYVPDYLIDHEYKIKFAPRTISFVVIPYEDVLEQAKQEKISPIELQAFFERENIRGRYRIPEKRTGKMWRFDAGYYGLAVPDERIKDYYEKHKKDFIELPTKVQVRRIFFASPSHDAGVKKEAEEIYSKLLSDPGQFAQLAKRFSHDKDSASKGGLIPYFSKGERGDVAFEKAAFLLNKNGQLSSVIETQDGYDIIQRVDKKSATYKPFELVKSDIRDILIQQKFDKHFIGDIKVMLQNKGINEKQWDLFIKDKSPQLLSLTDIQHDNADKNATKALYGLKEGDYTVYMDGQIGVVVQLDAIKKGYNPSLDEIYAQVVADRQAFNASKLLEAQLKDIQYGAETSSLEETVRDKGLSIKTMLIDPSDKSEIQSLVSQGFPINKIMQIENEQGVVRDMFGQDGMIIRLDVLHSFDTNDKSFSDEDKKQHAERLLQESILYLVEGYVASLYRDATIKTDTSLIRNII